MKKINQTQLEEELLKIIDHDSYCEKTIFIESKGKRGSEECDCNVAEILAWHKEETMKVLGKIEDKNREIREQYIDRIVGAVNLHLRDTDYYFSMNDRKDLMFYDKSDDVISALKNEENK